MKDNIESFTYKELFLLAIEKPMMAQLEVTRNCNQSCAFCFRSCNPESRYKDKSLLEWQKIIKKLVSIGVRELNFSGGEIFLYKDIDDLFKYAKSCGIKKIVVNTNGLGDLSSHNLADIDNLIFSIHGIEKVHDQITGINGSFKIAKKSIETALSKKCLVGINTVVTVKNIKTLKEIYDRFKGLKLIFHSFNLSIDRKKFSKGDWEGEKFFTEYLNFINAIPKSRKKLRHGMQNIVISDKKFFDSAIPLPHCAAGKYKLIIDYKGDVYPCRYFQTKKYLCGNIIKGDIKKIWKNGSGFKFFREIVLKNKTPDECQNCFKKYKCLGGCLAWRIFNKKTKNYEKDIRCKPGNAFIGS